jgi:hypothetical protein
MAEQAFAGKPKFDPAGTYSDEIFFALLEQGTRLARREADRLLREFGAELIAIFHEQYPTSYPPEGARRFLLSLSDLWQARIEDSRPGVPSAPIIVSELEGGKLRVAYQSPRRLCPLVAGMLEGAGAHYQTPVRHHEETCARKGDAQCLFVVEVQQTLLPRASRKRK